VTRACTIGLNYQLKLPEIKTYEDFLDIDFILTRPDQKPFSLAEVVGKDISTTAIKL
jgi:hypothetical protein